MEGFEQYRCDFVGGPVHPRWAGTLPSWLDPAAATTGKVLGLQNHGPAPCEYGRDGISWPLGANVAYRREACVRVGPFDARLGRVAGTLRNQSQREWHLRACAAGVRGMYLPGMVVHHQVSRDRLTRTYFHRWFYWHGISRAVLCRAHHLHLLEPEHSATQAGERELARVPLSLWRDAGRASLSAGWRWVTARPDDALESRASVWRSWRECFANAGATRSDRRVWWRRPTLCRGRTTSPDRQRHKSVPISRCRLRKCARTGRSPYGAALAFANVVTFTGSSWWVSRC